jgi:hypothetical protein
MGTTRQWIPAGGLLATIAFAAYAVVQLSAQTQTPTGDFTSASTAFVRDAQGQTVLQGHFMSPVEEDGGLERRATLSPTGTHANAAGEAEVEFAKTGATTQEVEFTVRNLPPDSTFVFAIDATDIGSARTNKRGRADIELDVRMPGSAPQ